MNYTHTALLEHLTLSSHCNFCGQLTTQSSHTSSSLVCVSTSFCVWTWSLLWETPLIHMTDAWSITYNRQLWWLHSLRWHPITNLVDVVTTRLYLHKMLLAHPLLLDTWSLLFSAVRIVTGWQQDPECLLKQEKTLYPDTYSTSLCTFVYGCLISDLHYILCTCASSTRKSSKTLMSSSRKYSHRKSKSGTTITTSQLHLQDC
jgi:hypothetical protein